MRNTLQPGTIRSLIEANPNQNARNFLDTSRQLPNQLNQMNWHQQQHHQLRTKNTLENIIQPPNGGNRKQNQEQYQMMGALINQQDLRSQLHPGDPQRFLMESQGTIATRHNVSQDQTFSIQVIFINHRVRLRVSLKDSTGSLLQKLGNFFDIFQNQTYYQHQLGILQRIRSGSYNFIEESFELKPGMLYYLYFKDTTKKGRVQNTLNPHIVTNDSLNQNESESFIFSPQQNNAQHKSQMFGISQQKLYEKQISCQYIEKISRPKEEQKILICPYQSCLKEFSETGNLKTHMRTHTGERPFSCGICKNQFITKGHLQAHELTHTGQKPFACTFRGCNKRYSRAGRLKIHTRLHTGERPFVCPQDDCEKTFREKGNLLTHLRTHNNNDQSHEDQQSSEQYSQSDTGKQNHLCDLAQNCNIHFSTVEELLIHQNKDHSAPDSFHSYACDLCQAKFLRAVNLQTHLMWHQNQSGSKTVQSKFVCLLCEKQCGDRTNLQLHFKQHDSEHQELLKVFNKSSFQGFTNQKAVIDPKQSFERPRDRKDSEKQAYMFQKFDSQHESQLAQNYQNKNRFNSNQDFEQQESQLMRPQLIGMGQNAFRKSSGSDFQQKYNTFLDQQGNILTPQKFQEPNIDTKLFEQQNISGSGNGLGRNLNNFGQIPVFKENGNSCSDDYGALFNNYADSNKIQPFSPTQILNTQKAPIYQNNQQPTKLPSIQYRSHTQKLEDLVDQGHRIDSFLSPASGTHVEMQNCFQQNSDQLLQFDQKKWIENQNGVSPEMQQKLSQQMMNVVPSQSYPDSKIQNFASFFNNQLVQNYDDQKFGQNSNKVPHSFGQGLQNIPGDTSFEPSRQKLVDQQFIQANPILDQKNQQMSPLYHKHFGTSIYNSSPQEILGNPVQKEQIHDMPSSLPKDLNILIQPDKKLAEPVKTTIDDQFLKNQAKNSEVFLDEFARNFSPVFKPIQHSASLRKESDAHSSVRQLQSPVLSLGSGIANYSGSPETESAKLRKHQLNPDTSKQLQTSTQHFNPAAQVSDLMYLTSFANVKMLNLSNNEQLAQSASQGQSAQFGKSKELEQQPMQFILNSTEMSLSKRSPDLLNNTKDTRLQQDPNEEGNQQQLVSNIERVPTIINKQQISDQILQRAILQHQKSPGNAQL